MIILCVIDIFSQYDDVKVGDIIVDTTSYFPFDMVTGKFSNDVEMIGTAIVDKIDEDFDDFDLNKCRTGGKYGFTYYMVKEFTKEGE